MHQIAHSTLTTTGQEPLQLYLLRGVEEALEKGNQSVLEERKREDTGSDSHGKTYQKKRDVGLFFFESDNGVVF
jgi:hypothetical protein